MDKLETMLSSRGDLTEVNPDIVVFDLKGIGTKPFNYMEGVPAWAILTQIFKDILIDDPLWHFFYEGDTSILRCSRRYVVRVRNVLDHHNVQYEYTGTWHDSQPATAKYHRVFTYLFHGFSVLAMTGEEDDLWGISDRAIHCFCNHQWYRMLARRQRFGETFWEASLLSDHAMRRAAYQAYQAGQYDLYKQSTAPKTKNSKRCTVPSLSSVSNQVV